MPASEFNTGKELLLKVAEGDEKAFRQVFDRYKDPFHAAAFKMTRSADISEEIVQEVFITLWVKRIQIAAADNPPGYLFKILYNAIYAHFKKIASEKQLMRRVGEQTPESENLVEDLLLAKENKKILDSVISRLPPQQQLVYKLSKQEGLSREEIAARLDISPNTVRNHLQEAVKFMRSHLNGSLPLIIWSVIFENL